MMELKGVRKMAETVVKVGKLKKLEKLLKELVSYPCVFCKNNTASIIEPIELKISELPKQCRACYSDPFVSFELNHEVECSIDCEECYLYILNVCEGAEIKKQYADEWEKARKGRSGDPECIRGEKNADD